MKLFILSLEEDALDWFTEQDDDKLKTLQEILDAFNERWGDRKEACFFFVALHASQKNENETMEEFNKKFNDLVKSIDKKVRPPDDAILIHYMESFDGEIRYQLRDKEPTDLKDAQKKAIKIERNMQASGKSNIPGFTRGTSSRSHEDKKKKPEIQESSSDFVKELTQLIKQMEINHANQLAAMQNRLINMERSQANRFQLPS